MLRVRHPAEDAVQAIFLDLARTAHRFRGDGRALLAWLYRTARRRCLDEVRRRTHHPEVTVTELPESQESDAAEDSELIEALESLSSREKELIVLRYVVGLDGQEVARVTKRTRGAVYAATTRAEKKLRSLMERRHE